MVVAAVDTVVVMATTRGATGAVTKADIMKVMEVDMAEVKVSCLGFLMDVVYYPKCLYVGVNVRYGIASVRHPSLI